MASIAKATSNGLDKLGWYLAHQEHTVWDGFGAESQRQMVDDDLAAGKQVSIVLVSLITTGMLLSLATLIIVLLGS